MTRAAVFVALTSATAAASDPKPVDVATGLVDKQVAAILKENAAEAVAPLFDDAFVLASYSPVAGQSAKDNVDALKWTVQPMTVTMRSLDVAKLVAGGKGKVMWLATDLDASFWYPESPTPAHYTLRLAELVVDGKVVAASLGKPETYAAYETPKPFPHESDAGPLTALVLAPAKLDAALATDPAVTVFGTDPDEHGFGSKDAHALIKKWGKLELVLDGKPEEVRTATYGFVAANLTMKAKKQTKPVHLRVLAFAIPDAGGWKIVSANYQYLTSY